MEYSQKDIFKAKEGDQYFSRNEKSVGLADSDLIVDTLKFIELAPVRVLEVGCSDGHRLGLLRKAFQSECYGIDPSLKAISAGKEKFPDISFQVGTADVLPFESNTFDTIIFGFCLYLCDRSDLFKIAYEADRCLQNGGTLIIKDFLPPFAFKNTYSHHEGIYSYKMDYSRMFSWNPSYAEVAKVVSSHSGFELRDIPNERVAVVVLRKADQHAYLDNPFK